jgi:hypothetical protein
VCCVDKWLPARAHTWGWQRSGGGHLMLIRAAGDVAAGQSDHRPVCAQQLCLHEASIKGVGGCARIAVLSRLFSANLISQPGCLPLARWGSDSLPLEPIFALLPAAQQPLGLSPSVRACRCGSHGVHGACTRLRQDWREPWRSLARGVPGCHRVQRGAGAGHKTGWEGAVPN